MASLNECNYDLNRCYTLLENIDKIIKELNPSIKELDEFSNNLRKEYKVNDSETPIVSRADSLKNNIEQTISYLSTVAINSVNKRINELKNEINSINSQLEYERRCAELKDNSNVTEVESGSVGSVKNQNISQATTKSSIDIQTKSTPKVRNVTNKNSRIQVK